MLILLLRQLQPPVQAACCKTRLFPTNLINSPDSCKDGGKAPLTASGRTLPRGLTGGVCTGLASLPSTAFAWGLATELGAH